MSCASKDGYANLIDMDGGRVILSDLPKAELYARAKKLGIKGRSKMKKAELVTAVRNKYKEIGESMRRKGKGKGKAAAY